jgi:hypothetical protein
MSVEKRIECVKEFFLRTLFAPEKLDVVDQQKVDLAITLPEFDQITVLDRVDELIDEQFTGDINHLHVFLLGPNVLADGLHQVGLAKTDTAINEQRVVRACGRLRYGQSRGMRNFIVRTNHEGFERVPRIEPGHRSAWFGVDRRFR